MKRDKVNEKKGEALLRQLNSRSGVVLIVVLWILLILTVLVMSLGRNTHLELSLIKYEIGKVKSKYLAQAGIVYAMEQIRKDSEDKTSNQFDTIYQCGLPSEEGRSLNELFDHHKLGDGYFDVSYQNLDAQNDSESIYFGIQDEERFLNINGLTAQNSNFLETLIVLLGFDEEVAKTISFAVLDWKDTDDAATELPYGAEDDYYESITNSYHCKNLPFDSKEEILLVKGVTEEIYAKLKDYITVIPKSGVFKLNFDTAPELVLRALANSVAGPLTQTENSDADAMVAKLIDYRKGEDGVQNTSDDRQIDINQIALNQKEKVLYLIINQYRTKKSEYFRIRSTGVEENRNIKTVINAIVERADTSIIAWYRQ